MFPAFVCACVCVFQRSDSLPDERNVTQLQEELELAKLQELETLRCYQDVQDIVAKLNQHWQARCMAFWETHVNDQYISLLYFQSTLGLICRRVCSPSSFCFVGKERV